jgi:hypothetical protein
MEDYSELREWLYQQEWVEPALHKSPYVATIRDNNSYEPVQALDMHNKVFPSLLIVTVNGAYDSWENVVYNNWENIPYETRLANYLPYFVIY